MYIAHKTGSLLNMTSLMIEVPYGPKLSSRDKVGSKHYFCTKNKQGDFSTKMGYISHIDNCASGCITKTRRFMAVTGGEKLRTHRVVA